MSDINETKIMPDNLPKDLEGIYRLLGYEDKNNYDDEEYKEEYKEALGLLGEAVDGGSGGGDNLWDFIAEKGMGDLYSTSHEAIGLSASFVSYFGGMKITTASFPDVISIGESAFTGCMVLTKVNFPKPSRIAAYAFQGCATLANVSIPNATYIGENAFCGCSALTTVSFPNVSHIGSVAFAYCPNLISLYLTGGSMSTVPELGSLAFDSTPIDGYSGAAGQYGSVYVPASLYESFLTAENWSYFASRIVSVAD